MHVFSVEVPREELLRRLSGRRWCPTCQTTYHLQHNPPRVEGRVRPRRHRPGAARGRQGDGGATRLAEYDERTAPLIEYYSQRARFRVVDGYRAVETVFDQLRGIVEIARMSVAKSWDELQKMHRACTITVETLEVLAQAAARASPPRSSTASPTTAS